MTTSGGMGLGQVTVSPAAIDGFARFLGGHVAEELGRIGGQAQRLAETNDFGRYDGSDQTKQRYTEAARARRERIEKTREATAQLAEATSGVAAGYRDVEQANATGAGAVEV